MLRINSSAWTPAHAELERLMENGDVMSFKVMLTQLSKRPDFDINARAYNGNSLLHMAARLSAFHEAECVEMADELVNLGADINLQNAYHNTPVCEAINRRSKGMIKFLIENKADLSIQGERGKYPQELAEELPAKTLAETGHNKEVVSLVRAGHAKQGVYVYKWTGEHRKLSKLLSEEKYDEFVDELDKALDDPYFSVNAKDAIGYSLLHQATYTSNEGAVKAIDALLVRGADVNSRNENDVTPVLNVCRTGSRAALKRIFKEKQADVNLMDRERGYSAAHVLAGSFRLDEEAVDLLKKHGADLNAKAFRGETPLMITASVELEKAAYDKLPEVVAKRITYLGKNGAKVNQRDDNDDTELHYAAYYCYAPIIEALKRLGSDVNAKNHDGLTPLRVAKKENVDEKSLKLLATENTKSDEVQI